MALFTAAEVSQLRREASSRAIHKVEEIEVWRIAGAFRDELGAKVDRNTKLELTRNDGQLYVSVAGTTLETPLERTSLVADDSATRS